MRDSSHGARSGLPGEAAAALGELYREAEERLAASGFACRACGRCCDFRAFDHELWLTELELLWLVELHGPRPPGPDGRCPYLEDASCTAREGRALGCRIFFCEAQEAALSELHEELLFRLKEMGMRWGVEPVYRELSAALASYAEGARARSSG